MCCMNSRVMPGGPWSPGVPKKGKTLWRYLCITLSTNDNINIGRRSAFIRETSSSVYLEVQHLQESQQDLWVQGGQQVQSHLKGKNNSWGFVTKFSGRGSLALALLHPLQLIPRYFWVVQCVVLVLLIYVNDSRTSWSFCTIKSREAWWHKNKEQQMLYIISSHKSP